LYQHEMIYYGFSPAVWVVVYLVSGRIAVLPWRR